MKRSEAILRVSEKVHPEALKLMNGVSTYKLVEIILEEFENLGMEPPRRKAKPSDFSYLGFDEGFVERHELYVNGWENEEK